MTQNQALVCAALNALGLQQTPPPDNRVGGEVTYKVTDDFIAQLKEGQLLIVGSDGLLEMPQKQLAE